jgi:sirohydrochlorin ferrochelatase
MGKKKRALIIVDHGSVVDEANGMLAQIIQMLREDDGCGFEIVRYSHMELAEPSISQTFDACVADGAEEIIVHPYFLFPGKHSTHDIPNMVKEAAGKHPQVSYRVTAPLGLHSKIVKVVLERANGDEFN